MSPAPTLTPQLALDYLRELSADIRAGVVLDSKGALLAGPEAMHDLVKPFGWRLPFARHWRGPLDSKPRPKAASLGATNPGNSPKPE